MSGFYDRFTQRALQLAQPYNSSNIPSSPDSAITGRAIAAGADYQCVYYSFDCEYKGVVDQLRWSFARRTGGNSTANTLAATWSRVITGCNSRSGSASLALN